MDNRAIVEDIKSKVDLVQVIQEHVPSLKRSGRNYFGLCPFHKEKSPSFSVNSEIGVYKCFGCGEGGDVIKFVEKIEGVDFVDALKILAKRAGVELNYKFSPQEEAAKQERELVLKANKLAAEFYNYILTKHITGEVGRAYIKKRQIPTDQVMSFQLGFAPKSYENLKNFLEKKGFDKKLLVRFGLLVEKNGKIYDKFRNRVIFPIHNSYGDVVGFSGRKIDEDDLGPKYLNSPETSVYKKSQLLFGIYQAKESIRKDNFVVLVEGNIDIISSHKAGVQNIVAPLGTAITEDQIKLIKRYTDKIYLAFDKDAAGQKAMIKAFEFAIQQNLEVYVIDFGDYKDIDEMIVSGGNWNGLMEKPIDAMKYIIQTLSKNYNLDNFQQKSKFVKEVMNRVGLFQDEIVKQEYVNLLSQRYSIPVELLIGKPVKQTQLTTQQFNSSQTVEDTPKSPDLPNIKSEKSILEKLFVEYLSLVYHNKLSMKDEEVMDVIGDSVMYKIYQGVVKNELIDAQIKLKYTDLISEVELNSLAKIDNAKLLQSVLSNIAKRIKNLRVKKIIGKIKRDSEFLDDNDSALEDIKTNSKLLKD